jgi:ornithine cyclodeaminase
VTRYIDIDGIRQLIARIGLSDFIVQLTQAIRGDFARWQQFEHSARIAHHNASGVIELMPMTDGTQYAFKYVNGHPKNPQRNLPTVMAFGALADVATGYPTLLSELTITTALRTAATSALAAQAQARSNASTMAMIGNGAQSEFQILAFHALLGIHEIRAYDIEPAATQKLMRNLAHVPNLHIVPATSVADAVRGADIITTATAAKTRARVLTPEMIVPGVHINAVGGDCPGKTELHPQILEQARVVVEYAPQTRIEGEIQQMPHDFPVTELWQVLSAKAPGRVGDDEVTIFDSVGFALEDFSALCLIRKLADAHDIGTQLSLVPSGGDPKDMYRLLQGSNSHH